MKKARDSTRHRAGRDSGRDSQDCQEQSKNEDKTIQGQGHRTDEMLYKKHFKILFKSYFKMVIRRAYSHKIPVVTPVLDGSANVPCLWERKKPAERRKVPAGLGAGKPNRIKDRRR